jgi:hypothetical protein
LSSVEYVQLVEDATTNNFKSFTTSLQAGGKVCFWGSYAGIDKDDGKIVINLASAKALG